jgi:hypothetical protein
VGKFLEVKPQLALLLVQPVALEAMLRQDRANLTIEIHTIYGGGKARYQKELSKTKRKHDEIS